MKLFSVFNLLAVAFLILAIGMIAVPDASSRRRLANEARVVRVLQRLALVQNQFRLKDREEASRHGTYAFLPELLTFDKGSTLPFTSTRPDGSVHYAGYRIHSMLPDENGRPVGFLRAAELAPRLAERSFLLLAEPLEPERTGGKAYAVRHECIVAQRDAPRNQPATRFALPRLPLHDSTSGRDILADTWRGPWSPFLTEVQAAHMKKLFELHQLPLPAPLQNVLKPK